MGPIISGYSVHDLLAPKQELHGRRHTEQGCSVCGARHTAPEKKAGATYGSRSRPTHSQCAANTEMIPRQLSWHSYVYPPGSLMYRSSYLSHFLFLLKISYTVWLRAGKRISGIWVGKLSWNLPEKWSYSRDFTLKNHHDNSSLHTSENIYIHTCGFFSS